MERTEIEEKYKWKITDIYESDEAWEQDYAVAKEMCEFTQFKGKLANKAVLMEMLNKQDMFLRKAEKLFLYAQISHDQDVRVGKYLSYVAQMQSLFTEFNSQVCFFDPEMMKLSDEQLAALASDPDLKDYDYALSRLLSQKKHVLSEDEEKIMALAGDVVGNFEDVFSMINNADLPLPEVEVAGEKMQLTHGTYGLLMHGEDREVRKNVFQSYYGAYEKLLNTITATYIGNVKKDIFYKTTRKYDSCLSKALFNEDVQPVVYQNLIDSVNDAMPAMHEYIELRKKILGLDEQHMYDIYVPLVPAADIKLPYEEAYQLVIEALAPLGKDYQNLLQKAFDERWIDVYENSGKRSGAYSAGAYDTHPFVLLNYQQTTNEIFTIAHEMGHSIHTYKSHSQPFSKASYTIFLAEIASTTNEVLTLKYLYKKTEDKELKKFLLNYYIEMFRTTLFRQTQFAEFEQLAHEKAESGEPLTKDSLNDLYYGLNKKYYGEGIVHDSEIAYEWSRIPHFYSSFYVYKYATGIISAVSIAKRILAEGDKAVEDYFSFLSGGAETHPVDILKRAGVDLTTKTPFETAFKEFADTLEEFKKLYDLE